MNRMLNTEAGEQSNLSLLPKLYFHCKLPSYGKLCHPHSSGVRIATDVIPIGHWIQ